VVDEFGIGDRFAVGGHDGGTDDLAEVVVWNAKHCDLCHTVVFVDGGLDFGAVNVLAAANHDVFLAVANRHKAVVVDDCDVAGVEPTINNGFGGCLGTVEVSLDDARPADHEFA